MATFDGSPSPVQLILVVENKTSKQAKEDNAPLNVTLKGKIASRWKKIRKQEGVNDVDLVQLLLDRFENTSHLFDPIPAGSASNTIVTSNGPIRITHEALPKGSGSEDDADEKDTYHTVTIVPLEESTEDKNRNDGSSESVVRREEDIDGTSQGDGTGEEANREQDEEDFQDEDEDGGVDAGDDWDSDPAHFRNGSESDEYKPESDSEWEEESDEISEEDWEDEEDECGRTRKKKKKISQDDADLPFKRYDMKEVGKTEGVLGNKAEGSRQRARIKRLYWTDMTRSYHCKICSYQYSSAKESSLHLLQEHSEMVGDLVTFLKSKPASDSEAVITMYDLVLETLTADYSFPHEEFESGGKVTVYGVPHEEPGSGGVEAGYGVPHEEPDSGGIEAGYGVPHEEPDSGGIEAGYGVPHEEPDSGVKEDGKMESAGTSKGGCKDEKTGSRDKSEEKEENVFDEKEFVTLLMRWVDIHVTCQHCQQEVCRAGVFTRMGNKVVHQCRTDEPETSVLCDICGKSLSYKTFRSHWKEVHGEAEQSVCQYCGKMYKTNSLNQHIKTVHSLSLKNKYPCGICGKGFKNKSARRTHEAIHKRDKPHVCTYCGRRFTQLSNMKYHMRQHTGEKPYQCETCHVSFTHNVSLKNHLKKQHGIDLWEMGYTGGGRPKKQKVQVEASE